MSKEDRPGQCDVNHRASSRVVCNIWQKGISHGREHEFITRSFGSDGDDESVFGDGQRGADHLDYIVGVGHNDLTP